MKLFMPDYYCRDLLAVNWDCFRERGIRLVFLDIDNTMELHGVREAGERSRQILKDIENAGLKACILSNAGSARAQEFVRDLSVPYRGHAAKPLTVQLKKALSAFGITAGQSLMVGDQVFTDLLCGRLAGCSVLFVRSLGGKETAFVRLKRAVEKVLIRLGQDPSLAPEAPLKEDSCLHANL